MGGVPLLAPNFPICRRYWSSDLSHHNFWTVYEHGCMELTDRPRVRPAPLCWFLGYRAAAATFHVFFVPSPRDIDTPIFQVWYKGNNPSQNYQYVASKNGADIYNACGKASGVCVEDMRGGDLEPTTTHWHSVFGGVF